MAKKTYTVKNPFLDGSANIKRRTGDQIEVSEELVQPWIKAGLIEGTLDTEDVPTGDGDDDQTDEEKAEAEKAAAEKAAKAKQAKGVSNKMVTNADTK